MARFLPDERQMAKDMPSKPSKPTAPKGAKHKQAGAGTRGRRIRPPRLYLYFDAVVRHGSIRRAAEALRIASSALNRRVLDLEEEIGTILFDRLQGGVRLTAAGESTLVNIQASMLGNLQPS